MSSEHIMARRETLQAMGLTLYTARYPLPGAAPSSVQFDVRASVEPQPDAKPRATPPAPDRPSAHAMPEVALAADPRADVPRRAAVSPAAPAASPALAPFTLAAVALGGCLWLEELPDGVLGRDQVQLMRAICHACGWATEPVSVNQFAWPMHRNPQFDQGADAAFAALSAFVQRQLEASDCVRLILLGQAARDRLVQQSSGAPVFSTHSTRDMLRDPLLKRDAWRDLRPR